MAHYLAELIDNASNAPEGPIRDAAQVKVATEILAIWAHRSALPGNAYPLARYKDIIDGMQLLAPRGSPWERPASGSRTAQAGEALEQLRQLSIACLFADHFAEIPNVDPVVLEQGWVDWLRAGAIGSGNGGWHGLTPEAAGDLIAAACDPRAHR